MRIREAKRDAIIFHWVKYLDSKKTETLRFASLVFRLTQLPFVLQGVLEKLEKRFEKYSNNYTKTTETTEKIHMSMI